MIAIGLLAVVLARLASRFSDLPTNRGEKLELGWYEHKVRCEGAFPFDYLTR
jgi:hypothetical protein